jgi:hypothetical protein
MKQFLIRLAEQAHQRAVDQKLRTLFGAVEPWSVVWEAEVRADRAAGKEPVDREHFDALAHLLDPYANLGSKYLPEGAHRELKSRTAAALEQERRIMEKRMADKVAALEGRAQTTMWHDRCERCDRITVHSGRGCSECRPPLGPVAKILDGTKLCHLCHCPGAVIAVDVSESYTTNVYHQICPRCLQSLVRGEQARRPREMGR